jgi:RimJ/RimL family protein N-acetyltransferase
MIIGEKITLMPYTNERCHELFKNYISDPMMTYEQFHYDEMRVNQYFILKVQDPTRRYFAIVSDGRTVGEIQLKYINEIKKYGTLSILIANDTFKDKGIGTEAIKLILNYAKERLQFTKVYADAIHRNSRSQHVLEGIGFKFIRNDNDLKYYEYLLND